LRRAHGRSLGQREGDALVLADGPVEDHAVVRIGDGLADRGASDADGLRGNEDAFGVEAIEQVAEALALLPHPVGDRDGQVVVAHLARHDGVAPDLWDRPDVDLRPLKVREQQRHPVGAALAFLERRRAHEQQHLLALQRLRHPADTLDARQLPRRRPHHRLQRQRC
jgi:hypothetical protein